MNVLIAIGEKDFDPTEAAVPWKILRDGGVDVHFATTDGGIGAADPRMLSGQGLGIWSRLMIANGDAQDAYAGMLGNERFQNPISFDDLGEGETRFDGLVLPGGHAKGMIPYLESRPLQTFIGRFFATGKPVAAICHGVIAACRSLDPQTGRSVLENRRTTALLKRQERLAYRLTKRKLGDYYLTYPITVQDEVTAALASKEQFIEGPTPVMRDSPARPDRGFTVRDGNYLSARWPGDAHKFSLDFLAMLRE